MFLLAAIAKAIAALDYRGCPLINLVDRIPGKQHPHRIVAPGNKAH
jgi:hypothetical protein